MKILFVRTDPGNVDPRIQKEAGSLCACGHEVHVLGWDRRSRDAKQEDIKGVHFHRVRIPAPYGTNYVALVLPLFWLSAALYILHMRPDVVHACDLDAYVPAVITRLLFRHKLIYDIFDHFAEKLTGVPVTVRNIIDRADRLLMRLADAVIVTDDERLRLIQDEPLRKIEVIMNVPRDLCHRSVTKDKSGMVRICYAGGIHEHRGLYQIVDAVRGLGGVEMVFAGWVPRETDRDYLKSQTHILYLGRVDYDSALRLLSSSDICLALYDPRIPINALASSNKVFEGMAAGIPVISNYGTTMERIISSEDCGQLVPYGRVDALSKTIAMLRDQPELRARQGNNGRAAFVLKYNWKVMEKRLVQMYAGL